MFFSRRKAHYFYTWICKSEMLPNSIAETLAYSSTVQGPAALHTEQLQSRSSGQRCIYYPNATEKRVEEVNKGETTCLVIPSGVEQR